MTVILVLNKSARAFSILLTDIASADLHALSSLSILILSLDSAQFPPESESSTCDE